MFTHQNILCDQISHQALSYIWGDYVIYVYIVKLIFSFLQTF